LRQEARRKKFKFTLAPVVRPAIIQYEIFGRRFAFDIAATTSERLFAAINLLRKDGFAEETEPGYWKIQ